MSVIYCNHCDLIIDLDDNDEHEYINGEFTCDLPEEDKITKINQVESSRIQDVFNMVAKVDTKKEDPNIDSKLKDEPMDGVIRI
jgi:hypothetical protein